MKKVMLCVCFVFMSLSLGACGTIEGVGKDISAAGDAIQRTF